MSTDQPRRTSIAKAQKAVLLVLEERDRLEGKTKKFCINRVRSKLGDDYSDANIVSALQTVGIQYRGKRGNPRVGYTGKYNKLVDVVIQIVEALDEQLGLEGLEEAKQTLQKIQQKGKGSTGNGKPSDHEEDDDSHNGRSFSS